MILPIWAQFSPVGYVMANDHYVYPMGQGMCIHYSSNASAILPYSWQTADGTYLAINTTYAFPASCPTEQVRTALLNLFTTIPGFQYNMGGVPVSKTAMGTPYSLFINGFYGAFGYSNAIFASSIPTHWVSQCLPVLEKNPVTCQPIGNTTISSGNLQVTSGNCTISSQLAVDPTIEGASVAGICTAGRKAGTATILFGSMNAHAWKLAAAMGNADFQGKNYSVACAVDILPSFTFRQLNYSKIGNSPTSDYWGVNATSEETCVPLKRINDTVNTIPFTPSLNDDLALATGAAASWQLLEENKNSDGFWPTIIIAAQNTKEYCLGFDDSENDLENVLGLSSAVAMGVYWGQATTGGQDQF